MRKKGTEKQQQKCLQLMWIICVFRFCFLLNACIFHFSLTICLLDKIRFFIIFFIISREKNYLRSSDDLRQSEQHAEIYLLAPNLRSHVGKRNPQKVQLLLGIGTGDLEAMIFAPRKGPTDERTTWANYLHVSACTAYFTVRTTLEIDDVHCVRKT